MKQSLKTLVEKITEPDTSLDWEEEGFDSDKIAEILRDTFRGELDKVRLYKNNGRHKWIFLGDFHQQPLIIGVGRYSSPDHYKCEHLLLRALNRAVPQFFPCVLGYHSINPFLSEFVRGRKLTNVISVGFIESLTHMDTAFDFKKKKNEEEMRSLAEREGYGAGFVLGSTGLVLTDPHPSNTLVYRVSPKELIVKFVDAERARYFGDLDVSLKKLVGGYIREGCVRDEVIRNRLLFMRGLEQGLEDSKAVSG